MIRNLIIRPERLGLREPFRISRGVKTATDVVVVEIWEGDVAGHGECVPYPRYGESSEGVCAQLRAVAPRLAAGEDPHAVAVALPAGAARNALDCAAWDLAARRDGVSVGDRIGRAVASVTSAVTISLDGVETMHAAAIALADAPLIKVKLDRDDYLARLEAVMSGAPNARLIVDPNESWTIADLDAAEQVMTEGRIAMIEQPLPAADDEALADYAYPVPICADEAIHTRADLDRVAGRYGMINIKLDKTGGLTEALALQAAARARGLSVMTGCMMGSSLSMAPALLIAVDSDLVDLDGPWWLREDRPGGCRFVGGRLLPPAPGFWGDPASVAQPELVS